MWKTTNIVIWCAVILLVVISLMINSIHFSDEITVSVQELQPQPHLNRNPNSIPSNKISSKRIIGRDRQRWRIQEGKRFNRNSILPLEEQLKKCQHGMYNHIDEYRKYLNSLDLWIVSHGGVGSNALIAYLENHSNIRVSRNGWYQNVCHLAVKDTIIKTRNETLPILLIVGDIWNSMISQYQRNWLIVNICRMRFGSSHGQPGCRRSLEWHIENFPDDPAVIKLMLRIYQKLPNVVIVKAPYTKQSIIQALKSLGFQNAEIEMNGFDVKDRSVRNRSREAHPELIPLYQPYRELQANLDAQPEILREL